MQVWTNLSQIITLRKALEKDGRNLLPEDLDVIENGTVVFDDDKIHYIGPTESLPEKFKGHWAIDKKGHVLTPEIVDCHTHLIFGGDRSEEYVQRLNGEDYQKIAQAGGGILKTMNGTNGLSEEELFKTSVERIKRLNSYGIGTIEIKSGYGLTYESEKRVSLVIDKLKKHFDGKIQIKNTYLAAHAVPKSFSSSNQYIHDVVIPLLKELAPLNIIDAVDIFHEEGYFDEKDLRDLFDVATSLKLETKIHADEFNDNNGAALGAEYKSLSVDHLLRTSEKGIKALADSNTVAVLLPGTGYFLGKPQANARKFLDAGAKVAIASDYNPGSCHWDNLIQVASFAAPGYKLNIAELWGAITLNAANALGIKDQGALKEGLKPRFSLFKVDKYQDITYNWGRNFSSSLS